MNSAVTSLSERAAEKSVSPSPTAPVTAAPRLFASLTIVRRRTGTPQMSARMLSQASLWAPPPTASMRSSVAPAARNAWMHVSRLNPTPSSTARIRWARV